MQARDPETAPDTPTPQVRRVRRLAPGFGPAATAPQPEPAGADGRLLRPAAACPRCGARPAMRVTQVMVHALDGQPAGARAGTYQCQRRGCGAIYDISVAAYLRAS